jgi:hypothetical protein
MRHFSRWWAEITAAVIPVPLGGLAIYLFQGNGAWKAMERWVSEGLLMPPAALLCISLLWTLHELREHDAAPYVKTGIAVLMFIATLVFSASVQPTSERELTTKQFFVWNMVLYLAVLASCVVIAVWQSRRTAVDV